MLANTYRGEVPTSPKMMPMALHSNVQSCTQSMQQNTLISTSPTDFAVVRAKVQQGPAFVTRAFPRSLRWQISDISPIRQGPGSMPDI